MYAVILAGGSGTRFWPKSRQREPKQLCRLGSGHKTLIEQTLERLEGLIPSERRLIVTHCEQSQKTQSLVGRQVHTILAEPQARNTAAALTLAALEIQKLSRGQNSLMLCFHADHVIGDKAAFHASLRQACELAEQGKLALIGVPPAYPETGYGYIERGPVLPGGQGFKVASFKEKPNLAQAEAYCRQGTYYWNSGLFIWPTELFLEEMQAFLPRSVEALRQLLVQSGHESFTQIPQEQLAKVYSSLQNIAIDHALLEVSPNSVVVEAKFSWHDVGSWGALERCFPVDTKGNIRNGRGVLIDSYGCTVDSDGPFIATLGLENMVVVAAKNAILVCPKSRSQEVKNIVTYLKDAGEEELL